MFVMEMGGRLALVENVVREKIDTPVFATKMDVTSIPYRLGDTTFLGPGKTVDTSREFTVVTQFLTNDNSSTGTVVEIRRLYVQDGRIIPNSKVNVPDVAGYESITNDFCDAQKKAFGDVNAFEERGGLSAMGNAFKRGMVLVMSIWDDFETTTDWLDSKFPVDGDTDTFHDNSDTSQARVGISTPESVGDEDEHEVFSHQIGKNFNPSDIK